VRVLSLTHQAEGPGGVFDDAVVGASHELVEWRISEEPRPPLEPDAVLVFGGTMHVDQEERHRWLRDELALVRTWIDEGVPLLGVCLGGQLLAKALGAPVRRMPSPEIGWHRVELTPEGRSDPVLGDLPERFYALQWHSYAFELPEGAVPLGSNERCLQAYRAGDAVWGLQFHAETRRTTLESWLEHAESAGDGMLDTARIRAESDGRMARWNALGREVCGRFLAVAGATSRPAAATTRAMSPRSS
jgi:GMP synthase (glutamine-hydrolysing)